MPQSEQSRFDHLPSVEELIGLYEKELESDPTSTRYKRNLVRPKPAVGKALLFVLGAAALSFGMALGAHWLFRSLPVTVTVGCLTLPTVFLAFAKSVTVWMIQVYQALAPEHVRRRCRFEPSCSQYMVLALEKYGFFKGLRLGINRLRRCKSPNGGIDLP